MLSQHAPSRTASIAHALVLKDGAVALVTEPDGSIPHAEGHGSGLYWKDVRWLDGYALTLDGKQPDALFAGEADGSRALLQLSDAGREGGGRELGVTIHRALDGARQALHDRIELRNYALEPKDVVVDLRFKASFDDIFLVRGLLDAPARAPVRTERIDRGLRFARTGLDGLTRRVEVEFSASPEPVGTDGARFRLRVEPHTPAVVEVHLTLAEVGVHADVADARPEAPATWKALHAELCTDSRLLDRIVTRAVGDLGMLRMRLGDDRFFAAGLPWFGTLFGRDSAVTAMQTLAWNPEVARETLRVLTRFQGRDVDPWREEQPGKILHELRRGPLARAGLIPHTPFYGTVDATPLYLCLLERTLAWTGDRALFDALAPAVDAALGWIDDATAADGWIWYGSGKNAGLANQGWKDSGDAIVNADGSLADPPIALVEVQGYVYRAWRRIADVFDHVGRADRAAPLRARAEALRARIRSTFRLASGEWALALQRGGRPCAVPTSNPGHLLWCGVLEPGEAAALAGRLFAPDLWSGWGVRTLGAGERRYNPVGYHLGTVWPHDNALIAAGLRGYGLDDDAQRICEGLLDACTWFEHQRMPELFAGFDRATYEEPVPYPVACRPQAWGAGSVLSMLTTLLGLRPDAWARRLAVTRPRLPRLAEFLTVRGLRVGEARVDLRFQRAGDAVDVEVLALDGPLHVTVEAGGSPCG